MPTPMLYINPETKEMAIFQDKSTDSKVVWHPKKRTEMIANGFVKLCGITGPSTVFPLASSGFTYVSGFTYTKKPEATKADALAYAEALVVILKQQEI